MLYGVFVVIFCCGYLRSFRNVYDEYEKLKLKWIFETERLISCTAEFCARDFSVPSEKHACIHNFVCFLMKVTLCTYAVLSPRQMNVCAAVFNFWRHHLLQVDVTEMLEFAFSLRLMCMLQENFT